MINPHERMLPTWQESKPTTSYHQSNVHDWAIKAGWLQQNDLLIYLTVAAEVQWFMLACDVGKCAGRIKVHAKPCEMHAKFARNSRKIWAYFTYLSKKSTSELSSCGQLKACAFSTTEIQGEEATSELTEWLKTALFIQQLWGMYMYAHFV